MMAISSVDLQDPDSVWINEEGRSLGIFCKKKPVRVDGGLIQKLKETSARLDGKNLRLCLHESPEAAFHEMIILERRSNYYRPHKHLVKGESYHIIEGSLGVAIFNDVGAVIDACVLEPGGSFIYRVGANMYHAVMPSVFPTWSPDGNDPQQVAEFVGKLKRQFRDFIAS
jgi:cupin fold WbuC family metalloprotein